jgi:Asp-tRNA(Asn)/Glu-tRNA(Gln) amidotransferase C subunit
MEAVAMASEGLLTREVFLYLAKEAGLDANSPHMEELYPYVQSVLASIESIKSLDVSGAEPDMAFIPQHE